MSEFCGLVKGLAIEEVKSLQIGEKMLKSSFVVQNLKSQTSATGAHPKKEVRMRQRLLEN